MKAIHGFDHTHKAVPANIGSVKVAIPVTGDGNWDLEAQRAIAKRFQRVRELLAKLQTQGMNALALDIQIK